MPASNEPSITVVGAGGDRLDDVAGVRDAAVGDDRHAALSGPSAVVNQIADSCGMPAPLTTRVVQIEPAPTPTLIASAPASASASTPSSVTTLPATTGRLGHEPLIRSIALITPAEWPWAVSIATASTPSGDERLDPLLRDRRRRRPPRRSAAGRAVSREAFGNSWRFWMSLTVIRPAQATVGVDERQLLDAVLLQDRLGLLERGADRRGDEPLDGHELGDRPVEVGARAEADVAVGEDADEPAVGVGDRHAR